MRFPFFWLKRKSKEEMAKRKLGRFCCWHQGTESQRPSRNTGDSEMTTIVRDSSSTTGNSLGHDDVYLWRQQALTSFLNAGCSISSKPEMYMEDPTADATRHSFYSQSDVAPHHKTDTLDTTPLAYGMSGSPRLMDMDKQHDSRKGPGLGAVDDTPPTRLSGEMMRQGLEEFTRRHQRNESIGNQAPELPTRLEVRRDHFSGPMLPKVRTVDTARQKISRAALGSYALPEPISPLGDSLSPPRRSRSPALDRNAALVSYEVKSIFSESTRTSRSTSPVETSRQSSPFTDLEGSSSQSTKQETETHWEIYEPVIYEDHPSKKQTATEIEEQERQQTVRRSITQLHRWHVHLKLGWLSEDTNDLVAEICLVDSQPLGDDIVHTSRATRNQTSYEIHSNEISDYEGNYPAYGNRETAVSGSAHIIQDADNRQNVVYIVDRILSELQKQKRRTRNKAYMKKAEMLDRQSKIDKQAHSHGQTEQQDDAFGTEHYRENGAPAERIQYRHEVLQAFEVLITKKEAQIMGSDEKREVGGTSSSEKQLTEAVYSDLRQEISRLQYELINKASSGEKKSVGLAEALTLPLKSASTPSRKTGKSICDGYRQRLANERCPGGRRSQSDPTSSVHPPVIEFPSLPPVQRSVSCYEESVSTPESFFAFRLPNHRGNTDERLAKIALLSEEMLFMRGTDSEAHVT